MWTIVAAVDEHGVAQTRTLELENGKEKTKKSRPLVYFMTLYCGWTRELG